MTSMINLSPRKAAIVAGSALIIMAIAAGFSYGFVLNDLIASDDAVATTKKIQQ